MVLLDVKPANVMVGGGGELRRTVLVDFDKASALSSLVDRVANAARSGSAS